MPDNKRGTNNIMLYISKERQPLLTKVLAEKTYVEVQRLALKKEYRGTIGFFESMVLAILDSAKIPRKLGA